MRKQIIAVALVVAAVTAGCGDSDEEPDDGPGREETTAASDVPSPTIGSVDLCTVIGAAELGAETGWTEGSSSAYIGDGSCDFAFAEASVNVSYETRTIQEIRDQSADFDVEEVPDLGDEAFVQKATLEITPESIALIAAEGGTVLFVGATEAEEQITEGELVEAAIALARACLEALPEQ